ncbi:GPI mannosyltransferase [Acrasis kona]|uniref:Mannosyltransferase n=1 Tax=Acrasis kona TaxID=1008807 RepID=A0AAW2YHZ3_9EUKA
METTLFTVMLYYYPLYPFTLKKTQSKSVIKNCWAWIFFAGLCCVMRPTNALMCAPLFLNQIIYILKQDGAAQAFSFVFIRFIPLLLFWLVTSIAIDSYMYGKLSLVVFQFLKFNVFENRSHMYGTQPWHWYLSQGFPVMLLTHTLLIVWLVYYRIKNSTWPNPGTLKPLYLVLYVNVVYSLFAHKEFRFVYPVLPLCFVFCGKALQQLNLIIASRSGGNLLKITLLALVIVPQILFAFYFSVLHQRGTLAAMDSLRSRADQVKSVHFLMPCHHAPGYSHIHTEKYIPMRHLDCSPIPAGSPEGTLDEADQFYEDPLSFVNQMYKNENKPSHIVMYEDMAGTLAPFLNQSNYCLMDKRFHVFLPHVHDRRMSEYVSIYHDCDLQQ